MFNYRTLPKLDIPFLHLTPEVQISINLKRTKIKEFIMANWMRNMSIDLQISLCCYNFRYH